MGLFGALFAGVSGLDSQSNKIGIISNNISNVNTVGYKQSQAAFDSLVVPSATTGTFSPGGVIGATQQLVAQQGIISATTSPTDVAISGNGLLVVNTEASGDGQTLYTREGSFTQDADGNFVNSDGYYLQGLPISALGVTAEANTQNLKTVSVSQSATGVATATSTLSVAANLNASQSVLLGPGETTGISTSDTTNVSNTGTQIIAPTTGVNNLAIGETLQISSNGNAADIFTYGGFTYGRNITTGTGGAGSFTQDAETGVTITGTGADTIKVSVNNLANYQSAAPNNYASLSGITTDQAGLTPAQLNGEWQILSTSGASGSGTIILQLASGSVSTNLATGSANVTNSTYDFASGGNILDANSTTGDFLQTTGTTPFTDNALSFHITTGGTTSTFTYNSVPNTSDGQFNSLDTLVQAINDTTGLTASVANNQLYVSATDANNAVTFSNGDATGNGATATPGDQLSGINWIQELNLPVGGIAQATSGSNTFNSLSGLAAQINAADPTNLTATVNNPTSITPTISIHGANPLYTLSISDGSTNSGHGSLVQELSFTGQNGGPLTTTSYGSSTGTLEATYDPTDNARNMSSGAVTPQFSKDVTVYDAQGTSHTLALNFVKLGTNNWAMEVTAVPASDVLPVSSDGQVASAILKFNGNGVLTSATGTAVASGGFNINWTNGAAESTISLDLGVNSSSGLIQTAAAFNVSEANQNGSPTGELTGVSIDASGFVIASFSNGQTQKLFQVPLASVNNPDGLEAVSGNAYEQTITSGIANLQLAGTSGVGTFTPSALEQSNVDLSTQLTDLIVAQQAYGANSKVLTVADTLLQQLDQIIQS